MTKRPPESCQPHGRPCETVPVMQAQIFLFAKAAGWPAGSERTPPRHTDCRFKDTTSTLVRNCALSQTATQNFKSAFRFIVSNSDAFFEGRVERTEGPEGPPGECLLNSVGRSRWCSTHANIIAQVTGVASRKLSLLRLAPLYAYLDIVVNSFFNTMEGVL